MAVSCYCSQSTSRENLPDLNIDSALHELGMLSSVTESRKEYLQEKQVKAKNSCSYQPELCILRVNSKYVTNFSFCKQPSSLHHGSLDDPANVFSAQDDNGITFHVNLHNNKHNIVRSTTSAGAFRGPLKMKMMRLRHHRFYRPYDFPWRPALEASLRRCWTEDTSVSTNTTLDPRQESANKSNPGSPMKSNSSDGATIPRSRSLDDLQKDETSKNCNSLTRKTEIDSVSHQISKLHVC
ncbi:uncharacterized protein LOC143249546 [Tachypleus tridentatus]|uniref:uncharacterized protein LOC143249546 n=1 Tax=Tachypleus tridentatus TaxID=6853 RepID=UPI003FD35BBF